MDLVADYIYNSYLGKDADEIADEELDRMISKIEKYREREQKKESVIQPDVTSSFNYEKLVGEYTNDEYGEVVITKESELYFQFGNMGTNMISISEDKFSVKLAPFTAQIGFTEAEGKITELILYGPSKIVFSKL